MGRIAEDFVQAQSAHEEPLKRSLSGCSWSTQTGLLSHLDHLKPHSGSAAAVWRYTSTMGRSLAPQDADEEFRPTPSVHNAARSIASGRRVPWSHESHQAFLTQEMCQMSTTEAVGSTFRTATRKTFRRAAWVLLGGVLRSCAIHVCPGAAGRQNPSNAVQRGIGLARAPKRSATASLGLLALLRKHSDGELAGGSFLPLVPTPTKTVVPDICGWVPYTLTMAAVITSMATAAHVGMGRMEHCTNKQGRTDRILGSHTADRRMTEADLHTPRGYR